MTKYEEKPVVMLHDEDDGRDFLCDKLSELTSSIDKLAVQVEILNQRKDGQEESVQL